MSLSSGSSSYLRAGEGAAVGRTLSFVGPGSDWADSRAPAPRSTATQASPRIMSNASLEKRSQEQEPREGRWLRRCAEQLIPGHGQRRRRRRLGQRRNAVQAPAEDLLLQLDVIPRRLPRADFAG